MKADDVRNILGKRSIVGESREVLDYQTAKIRCLEKFDKQYFLDVLPMSKGKLKKALELTGMHKKNFYKKLKSLSLSIADFK